MQDLFPTPNTLRRKKGKPQDQFIARNLDHMYKRQINQGYAPPQFQIPIEEHETLKSNKPPTFDSRTVKAPLNNFYAIPSSGGNPMPPGIYRRNRSQGLRDDLSTGTTLTLQKKNEWGHNLQTQQEERYRRPQARNLRQINNNESRRVHHSSRIEDGVYQEKQQKYNNRSREKSDAQFFNRQRVVYSPSPNRRHLNAQNNQDYSLKNNQFHEIRANEIFSIRPNQGNPNNINMNINNMYIINNSNGLELKEFTGNPNQAKPQNRPNPQNLGIKQIKMNLGSATVTNANLINYPNSNNTQNYPYSKHSKPNDNPGIDSETESSEQDSITEEEEEEESEASHIVLESQRDQIVGKPRSTHFDYQQQFEDLEHTRTPNLYYQRQRANKQKAEKRTKKKNSKFYSPTNPKIPSFEEFSNLGGVNQIQNKKRNRNNRQSSISKGKKMKLKVLKSKSKKSKSKKKKLHKKVSSSKKKKKSDQKTKKKYTPSQPTSTIHSNLKKYPKSQKKSTENTKIQPKLYNQPQKPISSYKTRNLRFKKSNQRPASPYKIYTPNPKITNSQKISDQNFFGQKNSHQKNLENSDNEKSISDFDTSKMRKLKKKFGGLDLEKLDMGNRVHKMNRHQLIQQRRDFNKTGEIHFSGGNQLPDVSHLASKSAQYNFKGSRGHPALYR